MSATMESPKRPKQQRVPHLRPVSKQEREAARVVTVRRLEIGIRPTGKQPLSMEAVREAIEANPVFADLIYLAGRASRDRANGHGFIRLDIEDGTIVVLQGDSRKHKALVVEMPTTLELT